LLVIRLDRRLDLQLSGRTHSLGAGTYVYCGNARGPGGLGARLARHLRIEKKPHWHVDSLIAAGRVLTAYADPDGSECRLLARLIRQPGSSVPLPGFGSSDCRRCPAHLVAVPRAFAPPTRLIRVEGAADLDSLKHNAL